MERWWVSKWELIKRFFTQDDHQGNLTGDNFYTVELAIPLLGKGRIKESPTIHGKSDGQFGAERRNSDRPTNVQQVRLH